MNHSQKIPLQNFLLGLRPAPTGAGFMAGQQRIGEGGRDKK